jgi:hypothetical protein
VIRLLLQGNLQGEDELLSPFFLLGYDGLNCSRFLDSRAAAPYNPKREDERGIESAATFLAGPLSSSLSELASEHKCTLIHPRVMRLYEAGAS